MWSAAMMLDHLGQPDAGPALIGAFETALAAGVRTCDLGGTASTTEVTDQVLQHCRTAGATSS